MKTFFEKIDALPIIRLLQVAALIYAISSIVDPIYILYIRFQELNGNAFGSISGSITELLTLASMHIADLIYAPLVLLALAEIIKLQKANLSLKQNHKIEENE